MVRLHPVCSGLTGRRVHRGAQATDLYMPLLLPKSHEMKKSA